MRRYLFTLPSEQRRREKNRQVWAYSHGVEFGFKDHPALAVDKCFLGRAVNLSTQSKLLSPVAERHRLYVLQASCLLDTPPDAALDRVTQLAARLFKAPIALISLIDEKRQWFKVRVGVEVTETDREDAFCAHTILRHDALAIPDATLDLRFGQNKLVCCQMTQSRPPPKDHFIRRSEQRWSTLRQFL